MYIQMWSDQWFHVIFQQFAEDSITAAMITKQPSISDSNLSPTTLHPNDQQISIQGAAGYQIATPRTILSQQLTGIKQINTGQWIIVRIMIKIRIFHTQAHQLTSFRSCPNISNEK